MGRVKHEIRAVYDDSTITVYQAYSPQIAGPALKAGRFAPPFERDRITDVTPLVRRIRDHLAREVLARADLDREAGLVGDNWSQRPSSRTPDRTPRPRSEASIGVALDSRATGGCPAAVLHARDV